MDRNVGERKAVRRRQQAGRSYSGSKLHAVWSLALVFECWLGRVVAVACQFELNRVAARSGAGFWPLATGGDLVAKWKKVPGRNAPAQSS